VYGVVFIILQASLKYIHALGRKTSQTIKSGTNKIQLFTNGLHIIIPIVIEKGMKARNKFQTRKI